MKKEIIYSIINQVGNIGNKENWESGKIHQKYLKMIVNHFTDKYF